MRAQTKRERALAVLAGMQADIMQRSKDAETLPVAAGGGPQADSKRRLAARYRRHVLPKTAPLLDRVVNGAAAVAETDPAFFGGG